MHGHGKFPRPSGPDDRYRWDFGIEPHCPRGIGEALRELGSSAWTPVQDRYRSWFPEILPVLHRTLLWEVSISGMCVQRVEVSTASFVKQNKRPLEEAASAAAQVFRYFLTVRSMQLARSSVGAFGFPEELIPAAGSHPSVFAMLPKHCTLALKHQSFASDFRKSTAWDSFA